MNALCTAPSRAVRNPTTRGESCGFVDESYGPARALRAVWTARGQRGRVAHRLCPHSRASRPQAPQDQPPVILTRQHRTTLRRGCLHRPFRTTSASHSNPSQHRPRPGSPPILQAHFRMGLDCGIARRQGAPGQGRRDIGRRPGTRRRLSRRAGRPGVAHPGGAADRNASSDVGFLDPVAANGTNRIDLFVCGHDTRVLLVARLDTLGKGASGPRYRT